MYIGCGIGGYYWCCDHTGCANVYCYVLLWWRVYQLCVLLDVYMGHIHRHGYVGRAIYMSVLTLVMEDVFGVVCAASVC